jgi:hypothetical protein
VEPVVEEAPLGGAEEDRISGLLLMTQPEKWVYSPEGSTPERSAFVNLIFFHSNGALTRLVAVIIEGLDPENPFVSISDGDGYMLSIGSWRAVGDCLYTAQYDLLDSYKASQSLEKSHALADFCLGPDTTSIAGTSFVHADSVLERDGRILTARYLTYVCRLLHGRHMVPECAMRR